MQQQLRVDTDGAQAMASRLGASVGELNATVADQLAAVAHPVIGV